jgi:glucosamine-6-phosphate isomerase
MKLKIYKDYQTLSGTVADEIVSAVKLKPDSTLCLGAGHTPGPAYLMMGEKAKKSGVDFSNVTFVGLDEWVGIPPDNDGSCEYFLHQHLFKPLGIKPGQIHLFDGMSTQLEKECLKMNDIVNLRGGIDLMVVGVGMNGHIGFNEPGIPFDRYAHVVELDSTTQTVGQKYFNEQMILRRGITLGMMHFLESKKVVLMANAVKKANVIRQALEGPVSPEMPASIVQKHSNAVVMVDKDAGSLLKV